MNKKQLNYFCKLFETGAKDKENNLEILKKELKTNGFKLCGMGASIMLDEMSDMGMEEDCVTYWKSISLHLPYEPAKVLNN